MSMLMAAKSTSLCYSHHSISSRTKQTPRAVVIRAYPTVRMQSRVHRLIEEQGAVLVPGVYDALSAAIVQQTGFSAALISGYALSASILGKPDFGLITPPEMAAAARSVCAAAPGIPILADADTGGGNALNVQRTVKDLIAAGAAGCFLEDQAWPKRCGHMRGKEVIPAEEHAAKIASARDAIGDSDFFLIARTDARALSAKTGLSDAIDRANLYMEAGADASFVEAPRDDDELKEIGKRTKGYRLCNMLEGGRTPLHTPDELKEMGFHLIAHPLTSLYASTRALVDVLKILKDKGTTKDHLEKMITFEEFNRLVNLGEWYEFETKYSNLRNALGTHN
ncbi:Phosphoenolpyruvate carboxylase family protein [Raphanus sativus]|uniref:Carboxyvinyl-carboxyphosphonate phosphorylmutase, chloroplastic n=1 Tax=Raphanus sativus TaxID=3726 RepID=A0A6J0M9Z1_RAPSA|nr:carboxyvinyl-carboxyphosphonate phosphorylmutase, chloroplastic [Raphanus sativus]KAJ4916324.1 Phosphoenolpyruvate carboxylase family protein [Raphanus sativus]